MYWRLILGVAVALMITLAVPVAPMAGQRGPARASAPAGSGMMGGPSGGRLEPFAGVADGGVTRGAPMMRGAAPMGGPPSDERMKKIMKRIEMVRMWRLTEELDLDEATAAKLFPILSRYESKRMELQKQMFELRRKARLIESGRADKQESSARVLDELEKNRTAMHRLRKEQNKELKKVLTPTQMLKYLSFEERFRREMRQMIMDARGRRGGPRADRPPAKENSPIDMPGPMGGYGPAVMDDK